MKNVLLSFALIILVILLLLPPGLKIFGKNLYTEKKVSKQQDKIEILNCTKMNETISTSFVNSKAYNIKYEISGNHVPIIEEEEKLPDEFDLYAEKDNEKEENINNNKNTIIEDFQDYAEVKYLEEKNLTEYRIALNLLEIIPEKLQNHARTIEEVKNYYSGLSFSCTIQKY